MDHAARIVERLVIDREPRMLGLAEHAHQLVDGDRVLDGDDVGARHHHVLDRQLAEPEDAPEHVALLAAQRDRSCCGPAHPRSARAGQAPRRDRKSQASARTRTPPPLPDVLPPLGRSFSAVRGVAHGDTSAGRALAPLGVRIGDAERGKRAASRASPSCSASSSSMWSKPRRCSTPCTTRWAA